MLATHLSSAGSFRAVVLYCWVFVVIVNSSEFMSDTLPASCLENLGLLIQLILGLLQTGTPKIVTER